MLKNYLPFLETAAGGERIPMSQRCARLTFRVVVVAVVG